MKNILPRNAYLFGLALAAVILAGSMSAVAAQNSDNRTIDQAQRAVRQRIVSQERGRNLTVVFNDDAETTLASRTEVRVRGTGSFSRNTSPYSSNSRDNDQLNNDRRNNGGRSREFSYEAIVNNRRGYGGGVSAISYEMRSDRGPVGGRDNNDRDDRDNTDRDNHDRDNDNRDNDNRDNNGRDRDRSVTDARPDGRVRYSGPIVNRHSDKALDVTERSNRNGANIQQWSYAEQPNQQWDVIDLGNDEAAIISRQSGRALTIIGGGRDNNGANIIQQSWRGSPTQRWRLEQTGGDYYRIVSVDNGKCLDVTREGKQDGANIQLWDYANQANQQWRLRR